MPIRRLQGDILADQSEALVNTVNCVGYMGRGIALQFKRAFPRNNAEYVNACRRGDVQPGRMLVHVTGGITGPKYIINFPTKRHWRGRSRLEDIDSGLVDLVRVIQDLGVHSIAIPPLGSGLGGLEWADVRPRIEGALAALGNVDVTIYEPNPSLGESLPAGREVPKMTPGRATLVALIAEYLSGMMDSTVTLLEIHKLMYFMQVVGEPLRLRFRKGHYGPYAENLRHVLTQVEGYLLAGYRGVDEPSKPLELVPGALEDARRYLEEVPATSARLSQVTDLVQGFESPVGLELLASVDWVVRYEHARTSAEAVTALSAWNERKRRFTPLQIEAAWDALSNKGLITSQT